MRGILLTGGDAVAVRGRAFTLADGRGGSTFRVVLAPTCRWPDIEARQAVAAAAGQAGTAYVDPRSGRVVLHNPTGPRWFVGHTLLGVAEAVDAWCGAPDRLDAPAGRLPVWSDAGRRWLRGQVSWSHYDRHRQLWSADEVDALTGPQPDAPVQVWAWLDEPSGRVRARQLTSPDGRHEDEACGSATMVLGARLGRPVLVSHGRASEIVVRPEVSGVALGGRVALDRWEPAGDAVLPPCAGATDRRCEHVPAR